MRLELGTRVDCTDGPFGELADVVIDPDRGTVTHLVVQPDRGDWFARLVPIALADRAVDASYAVSLLVTIEDVRGLPAVRDVAFLRLREFVVDDPDWEVGVQEVFALPYNTAYDLEPVPLKFAVVYDRIPKSDVEIRRESSITSADGEHLGDVDGFLIGSDDDITHLVLEQDHALGRREVTIPVGAVAKVETDAVTLKLTQDDVGALPVVPVHRRLSSPLRLHRPGR